MADLQHELEILKKVGTHPNVVQLHGYSNHQGKWCTFSVTLFYNVPFCMYQRCMFLPTMSTTLERHFAFGSFVHSFVRPFVRHVGVVGSGNGVVYLTSPGRPTEIGLQLGKACYPCSR